MTAREHLPSTMIKAIPTRYAGVNFRSRLEARWAAFFDLCKWPWEYEPCDFDGWIPDFRLKGKHPALVEVKPFDFDCASAESRLAQTASVANKAWRFANELDFNNQDEEPGVGGSFPFNHEILILGLGPFQTEDNMMWGWHLGILARELWGNSHDEAILFEGYGRALDYAANEGSYAYRIGGQHDGDGHLKFIDDDSPLTLWKEAGNVIQWRAPPS